MNDHFWPSLYPGMIIGGLLGLTFGGIVQVLIGVVGGTAGAAAMYFVTAWLGWEETVMSLIALIGGAVAGSFALARLYAHFAPR
jgi:hypothetical protein